MVIDKKSRFIIFNFIMFGICFLSALYIFFNVTHVGYSLLFTQPIVYFISFIVVLSKKIIKLNNNLFYLVFVGASFIRYVLLPVSIVYSGFYSSHYLYSPSNESYLLAIVLMNVELILVSSLLLVMNNYKKNNNISFKLETEKSKNDGYYLFIMLTVLLTFVFPRVLLQINFIKPSSLDNSVVFSTIENIVLYCGIVSKQLIYIILMKKIWVKYIYSNSALWVHIGVLISTLNIGIYFSGNRMDIVINAIVTIYILIKIYGKRIYKYFLFLIPLVIFMFVLVTENRAYVSYTINQAVSFTANLQAYTGGIYNVATAIETVNYYPQVRNIKVFLMDIFRPMIGPNIIVKNINVPYSNIFFNRTIRPSSDVVSQIIPMVGQGYIFFGGVFSSLLSLVFTKVQNFLEKFLNNTYSLEVFYFISLSSARLGMLMGNNTMNLINDLSMNLVLFSIVYIFNKYFRFFKQKEKVGN